MKGWIFGMKFTFLKKIWRFADVNSPVILSAAGIVGFISAIPIAIKCKAKADRLYIQLQSEKQAAGLDPKLTKGERIKVFVRGYWVTGVVVAVSGACIVLANVKWHGRVAGLKTALLASQGEIETLKETIKEQFDEKQAEKIFDKSEQKRTEEIIKNTDESLIEHTGYGDQLCCDLLGERLFYSDIEHIRRGYNDFNEQRLNNCFDIMDLNDLYFCLGMRPSKLGEIVGWGDAMEESTTGSPTSNVLPDFVAGMLDDGRTYIGVRPSIEPVPIDSL